MMELTSQLGESDTDILSDLAADEVADDLHLAALLGKKLLQKNGNLETQLKKLEDFAEETFISNQVLLL
jgi:hypothetical protein